ncbi:transposase [Flavobacterium sp.]|uniref:transposase n=1 Tax=Flavobacterium sp. TaxID=239 RepID=UPI002604530B|nr:transposase [Flavobacterium sp.]
MKTSKFSEEQIISILKEQEQGFKVVDICRKHGLSEPTFYSWKKKYDGFSVSELRRLRELEQENSRLKRAVADLTLDNQILKDVNSKKW